MSTVENWQAVLYRGIDTVGVCNSICYLLFTIFVLFNNTCIVSKATKSRKFSRKCMVLCCYDFDWQLVWFFFYKKYYYMLFIIIITIIIIKYYI